MNLTPQCVSLIISLLLVGCAQEHIPVYPEMPDVQAMQVLVDRAHAVKSVSAPGSITLTKEDGQSIRLEAAMVLELPSKARVRAWKFGQAVFDMTLTPQGVWMVAGKNDERRKEILAAGTNTGSLTRQWLQLITGALDTPGREVARLNGKLVATIPAEDGTTLRCEIDRKTLTARRYTLTDAQHRERFSLSLGRYQQIEGIVWPTDIEATSQTGRIHLELRDITLNGELEPGAFKPPARAEKLP